MGQIHMSEVRDIACPSEAKERAKRKIKAGGGGGGYQFDLNLCAEIGFMFEDALGLCFKDRMRIIAGAEPGTPMFEPTLYGVERPGEIEFDGVLLSPDGIDLGNAILHEFKFRWASMPQQMTDNPLSEVGKKHQQIFFQVKCYLHALNEIYDEEWKCVLWILWSSGDRRANPGPVIRPYLVTHSRRELALFWKNYVKPTRDEIISNGYQS